MVKIRENQHKPYRCYIQEISPNRGPCIVYIEDTAEKRTVATSALIPIHAEIGKRNPSAPPPPLTRSNRKITTRPHHLNREYCHPKEFYDCFDYCMNSNNNKNNNTMNYLEHNYENIKKPNTITKRKYYYGTDAINSEKNYDYELTPDQKEFGKSDIAYKLSHLTSISNFQRTGKYEVTAAPAPFIYNNNNHKTGGRSQSKSQSQKNQKQIDTDGKQQPPSTSQAITSTAVTSIASTSSGPVVTSSAGSDVKVGNNSYGENFDFDFMPDQCPIPSSGQYMFYEVDNSWNSPYTYDNVYAPKDHRNNSTGYGPQRHPQLRNNSLLTTRTSPNGNNMDLPGQGKFFISLCFESIFSIIMYVPVYVFFLGIWYNHQQPHSQGYYRSGSVGSNCHSSAISIPIKRRDLLEQNYPVNFLAMPSYDIYAADIINNDSSTLRFFYNLGHEYFRHLQTKYSMATIQQLACGSNEFVYNNDMAFNNDENIDNLQNDLNKMKMSNQVSRLLHICSIRIILFIFVF